MRKGFRVAALATVVAAAVSFVAGYPAHASTFNVIVQTVDQTNGFDFNLTLTGDGSNNLVGASGSITGLGVNSGYSGTVTGFLLPGSPGSGLWNFDNKIYSTAPYFTPSGCCSGILLSFNTTGFGPDYVNLYTDGAGANDYASFMNPGDNYYNPGLLLDLGSVRISEISSTPLPSTWTMLIAAFAGIAFFAYRGARKTANAIAV